MAIATGTSLTIGYVAWLIRGGVLVSNLLTSMPAWRLLDPLPILGNVKSGGSDDDDSLESMVSADKATPAKPRLWRRRQRNIRGLSTRSAAMMRKLSAKAHISLGLAFLVVSVLLVAAFVGLIPDRAAAVREGRVMLAESIAASSAEMASHGEVRWLAPALRLLVKRNDDSLRCAAHKLRRTGCRGWFPPANGPWTARIRRPTGRSGAHSRRRQDLGQLELRFRPIVGSGLLALIDNPLTRLVGFVFLACLAVFYAYLRKVLLHLDPSGRCRAGFAMHSTP